MLGCLNVFLNLSASAKALGSSCCLGWACWGTGGFSPFSLSQGFVRLACKPEGWMPAEYTLKLGFLGSAALNEDFAVLKI